MVRRCGGGTGIITLKMLKNHCLFSVSENVEISCHFHVDTVWSATRFRNLYLDEIAREFQFAVRDYVVPFDAGERFLSEVIDVHFGTDSVLWICPVVDDETLFLNIGVYLTLYGVNCAEWTDCVSMYSNLERETVRSGGRNWFYAASFLEREQFERLHLEHGQFDYALYQRARREHDIVTADLYSKIGTIGSRDDLRQIRRSRPRHKYLSHFPVAIKYAIWWIYDRFRTSIGAE